MSLTECTEMPSPRPPIDSGIIIRDSSDVDIAEIQAIYAHEVLHGLASFETVPPSSEELLSRRQGIIERGLPFLAAEMDGRVIGYSYASPYRSRPAYRNTIEDSVYVGADMQGRGVGRLLLANLIERCERGPWSQMIAVIGNSGNAGSIALHEHLGFRTVGTLESVGFKFGLWIDSVLMQRSLSVVPRRHI